MVGGRSIFRAARAKTGRETGRWCASAGAVSHARGLSPLSHAPTACIVGAKTKTADEKNPDCGTIGASVEGSATRSGSLTAGAAASQRAALQEVALQRLAAGEEAVVAVGRRERRQEGERLSAQIAETASNANPVMVFVMSLFASATMTDDGILPSKWDIGAG